MLNAFGAAALFFTNLLAIIVMSSFTFSLLGVRESTTIKHHRRLAGWGRIGLVVLVLVIAGPLSNKLLMQLEEGKSVTLANPVTKEVASALFERVAQDEGVDIMFLARPRAEHRVMIHIVSRDELPPSYATELRKITREAMDDPDIPVTVVAVRGSRFAACGAAKVILHKRNLRDQDMGHYRARRLMAAMGQKPTFSAL